jgi:hypothetical protein
MEATVELPLSKTGCPIDPLWAAEFTGLFWGEGMLSFCKVNEVRQGKKGNLRVVRGPFYRNEAIMVLRADDNALLQELCSVLGGHVNNRPGVIEKNQAPERRWVCSSLSDCFRVGQVLSCGRLPAKKILELPIWMEALDIRIRTGGQGHHLSQEQKDQLEQLRIKIHEVRAYSLDKVQVLQSGQPFLLASAT